MGKVSIGFRGWRFDEDAIFDESGDFRPLDEMPDDDRQRLVRLTVLDELPCDACYLIHGDENIRQCNVPVAVYGEPFGEVLVCDEHERDFYYWFLEAGGRRYKGEKELENAFCEWFADGGRAPDEYDGPEHVDTGDAPDPDVPSPEELDYELPEEEREQIDIDLDVEYPE